MTLVLVLVAMAVRLGERAPVAQAEGAVVVGRLGHVVGRVSLVAVGTRPGWMLCSIKGATLDNILACEESVVRGQRTAMDK